MILVLDYRARRAACLAPFAALNLLFLGHRMLCIIATFLRVYLFRTLTNYFAGERVFYGLDAGNGHVIYALNLFLTQCACEVFKTIDGFVMCHNLCILFFVVTVLTGLTVSNSQTVKTVNMVMLNFYTPSANFGGFH